MAVFEISLPAEAADFGLANQKEILFDLKIEDQELDSEKEVILEEFGRSGTIRSATRPPSAIRPSLPTIRTAGRSTARRRTSAP